MRDITDREKEIMQLLLTSKSLKQIAKELCITYATVRTHVNSLYEKLKINDRHELMANVIKRQNQIIEVLKNV